MARRYFLPSSLPHEAMSDAMLDTLAAGSSMEVKQVALLAAQCKAGATLVENWNAGKIKLYKHTYPANDPSEDRSTLVVGDDFLFCGVWDGA